VIRIFRRSRRTEATGAGEEDQGQDGEEVAMNVDDQERGDTMCQDVLSGK
jgi:hypothetical protein